MASATRKSTWRQFGSVMCANLLAISFGSMNGWASANFLELQKTNTLLPSGPMSLGQATLMVSITGASAAIGNLVTPFFINVLGSKRGLFLLGFPQIISWLLVIFAVNPYYLLAARVITGFVCSSGALFETIFIYEISHDYNRGTLLSLFDPSMNAGIVFSFILGKYFDYIDQAKIHLCVSILYVLLFFWIPQTPKHLMKKQQDKAANKAQRFFKCVEFEAMPVPVVDRNDTKCDAKQHSSKLKWSDFTTRQAKNALFIVYASLALNPLQGYSILLGYVSEIFSSTNPNISPYNSSIIITSIVLVANLIFSKIVDRAGRRTFFVISSFATTIGLAIFAVYLKYLGGDERFDWVPVVCLSSVLFVGYLGMIPATYIVAVELLPEKIKNYSLSGGVSMLLAMQFILSEIYPTVKEQIGLLGWIIFFTGMCLCNALFGIFYMPETRGKSYDEIMDELDNM